MTITAHASGPKAHDPQVRRRRGLAVWLVALILAPGVLTVGGCARAAAKMVPDGPPLEMPAPPARVIAPAEEPIASAPAEPAEPAPAPPSTIRRPVRRPAGTSSTDQGQKPETTPAEPAAAQSAPELAVTTPPPTLHAPGSAEKPVRDRLQSAQRDLARVDYSKLTDDGRAQYEQSKRFVQQAEQALKDQNIVFAQTLADKAATLAAELLGR
ncbi:MAG: hypothetical protein ACRD26_18260 [Vicinamibacterales bacterium]